MLDNFKKKFNQFYNTPFQKFVNIFIVSFSSVLSWRLKNTKKKKKKNL